MVRSDLALRQTLAAGLVLLAGLFVIGKCTGCTPAQREIAHDVSDTGCEVVQALAHDGTVERVCAIADDIQTILGVVMSARADAGRKVVRECAIIPTTTVCATNDERLAGIRAVRAKLGAAGR